MGSGIALIGGEASYRNASRISRSRGVMSDRRNPPGEESARLVSFRGVVGKHPLVVVNTHRRLDLVDQDHDRCLAASELFEPEETGSVHHA